MIFLIIQVPDPQGAHPVKVHSGQCNVKSNFQSRLMVTYISAMCTNIKRNYSFEVS